MPAEVTASGQTTRNEALFRRLIEEGFSRGNAAVVDEVMAPDFVERQNGIRPPDREGVKAQIASLHGLLPDLTCTIVEMVASGDKVWAHLRGHGTHAGAASGGESAVTPVEIDIIDICRFADGKIVEHWGVADRLGLLEQTGLLPARESK